MMEDNRLPILTEYQKAQIPTIIEELKGGRPVMCHITESGHRVWSSQCGKKLSEATVTYLVDIGVAEFSGDGLFGDSQTVRLGPGLISIDEMAKKNFGEKHVVIHGRSKKSAQYRDMGYRIIKRAEMEAVRSDHALLESALA